MAQISDRKHHRIDFKQPGFVILEPDGPWVAGLINDVSESGVCIDVGALVVPEIFVLCLNSSGSVRRAACACGAVVN